MPIKINFEEKFEPNMSKVPIPQRGALWTPPPSHLTTPDTKSTRGTTNISNPIIASQLNISNGDYNPLTPPSRTPGKAWPL